MSMVRCSQCGAAFSSYRTACPSCGAERNKGGARLKKKSGPDARLIITIVLILAVIACIIILATMIFGGDKEPSGETNDPPVNSGDTLVPDEDGEDDEGENEDPIGSGTQTPDDPDDPENDPEIDPVPPTPEYTVDTINLNVQWYASISGYEVSFVVGESFTFKATTSPDTVDVVWASNDPSVVQIDEDGKVVAMGRGVTEITATYEDVSVSCIIRVN